jgi:hypothetical protein
MTTLAQQLHHSAGHEKNGPDPFCPVCNPSGYLTGDETAFITENGTIDFTPKSLTTPGGIARVNQATREFEDSAAELANTAMHFFDQHGADILHCMAMYDGIAEDVAEIRELIATRKQKQEAFLRALSGN